MYSSNLCDMNRKEIGSVFETMTANDSDWKGIQLIYPPNSGRLPVTLSHSDFVFELFDLSVHWIAYFVAISSVFVSLMICMAVVFAVSVLLLEMIGMCADEMLHFLKSRRRPVIL